MSYFIETIKTYLGITNSNYDYLFILIGCIMILIFFQNILGMFKLLFDIVGGKR